MKKSIFTTISLIIFIILSACSTQNPNNLSNPAKNESSVNNSQENYIQYIKIDINGVKLGTEFGKLLDIFGKPLLLKKEGQNPCGGEDKLIAEYEGLKFHLDGTGSNENFGVIYIDITSPKWKINKDFRIGATVKDIEARFGKKHTVENANGNKKLNYADTDGYVNFYFEDDKLIKIERILNLC